MNKRRLKGYRVSFDAVSFCIHTPMQRYTTLQQHISGARVGKKGFSLLDNMSKRVR